MASERIILKSVLIRASLVVLLALICAQLVEAKVIESEFSNARNETKDISTTTVCVKSIVYI